MTLIVSILQGGANSHETTSEEVNAIGTDFFSECVVGAITNTSGVAPATGAFAVNAQGSPNMTVAVSAGVAYVTATPTSGNSQLLRVKSSASENVTISANSTGGTRYDWVYIKIDPDKAKDPNAGASDVATLVTSRSTSAITDDGTPPTYGYPIAVVTVANGASSISNGNIADQRTISSGGSLTTIQVYTSSTTWTKPSGLKFVIVEVVGGGGAGGGAASTSGGESSGGNGGHGGGYAMAKIEAADLSASETVTVGAGGTGGTGTGPDGSSSSFGSLCVATGGGGGAATAAGTSVAYASVNSSLPGNGTTGDVLVKGSPGQTLFRLTATVVGNTSGGSSFMGGGGPMPAGSTAGIAGGGYGAGGSGARNGASQSARNGGSGSDGLVRVYEYFS